MSYRVIISMASPPRAALSCGHDYSARGSTAAIRVARMLITGLAARGTLRRSPEMNERGKSDRPVVPANPPNKTVSAGGGGGEGRGDEPRGTGRHAPARGG